MSEAILAQIVGTLNRIEGKVDENHKIISDRLHKHMEDEEGEIDAIMQIVSQNREDSERRYSALIQSINSYMEKQNEIETAFLKQPDGKPDLIGHRTDHSERVDSARRWDDRRNRAMNKLIEWAAVGIAGWMLYIFWQALLAGPK